MLIRCLLLSVWRKSGPAQFSPSSSTKYNWCWKIWGGEKTDWVGKKLTSYFFLPGKKMTSQFLPGEEMGRPDPSPGKDWRGGESWPLHRAGADKPLGSKFQCQQKGLNILIIYCKFWKKSLWTLILYTFFNVFSCVYSPGAGADNALESKFWSQQKGFITLTICCKLKKVSFNSNNF